MHLEPMGLWRKFLNHNLAMLTTHHMNISVLITWHIYMSTQHQGQYIFLALEIFLVLQHPARNMPCTFSCGILNNLKHNPKKVQLKSTECKFFGQVLTLSGMQIDQDKVDALRNVDALGTSKSWNLILDRWTICNCAVQNSPNLQDLSLPSCRKALPWPGNHRTKKLSTRMKRLTTSPKQMSLQKGSEWSYYRKEGLWYMSAMHFCQ